MKPDKPCEGFIDLEDTEIITQEQDAPIGYAYKIIKKEGWAESDKRAVIIIDAQRLDWDNLSPVRLKFSNVSGLSLLLKILVAPEDLDKEVVDQKLDIILSDKTTTAKTSIERVTSLQSTEDYLIAVIVRDKAPRIGRSGKIIKTMIDVYTFNDIK